MSVSIPAKSGAGNLGGREDVREVEEEEVEEEEEEVEVEVEEVLKEEEVLEEVLEEEVLEEEVEEEDEEGEEQGRCGGTAKDVTLGLHSMSKYECLQSVAVSGSKQSSCSRGI